MFRRCSRSIVRGTAAVVAVILIGAWSTQAQQGELPTAREVIDRYVSAIGGSAAFRSINSMRARGTFEITGQQLSGELEMMASRPNKLLTRVRIGPIGQVEEGFDGKVGWSIDPMRGPSLVTGRSLDERADEAWFDAPLHGDDHVKSMTVVGKEEFDGRPAYRLKVVAVRGTEQFELFDVENGFQVGSEASRDTPFGIVPTTTTFRDYQRFGQLLLPSRVIQRVLGQEQVFTFTLYEFNTVPPNTFDLPAPIKALLK